MSTTNLSPEDFLSDRPVGELVFGMDDSSESETSDGVHFKEAGYTGTIDYRIRQLSYSSILTLHQCPRKFQLYKLRTTHRSEELEKSTITFSFGHVVGEAIQMVFEGLPEEQIIWKMFRAWRAPLFAIDEKLKKSFWTAIIALQKFISLRKQGFLDEYDLVHYNGRPATELSFAITFPDGFRLRGFVDAVLVHKVTGKIIVLECKTTGATNVQPATYKNSSQAIGYSIVLDAIFPALSDYEVLYLVYQTGSLEFTTLPFKKDYLQRALWIRELLLEIERIKMYEEAEIYPMHGESCFMFGRECEYYQTCTLSTAYLTKPCTPAEEDTLDYQVNITLLDLLDAQARKAGLTDETLPTV